jgi:hypothetical protein
MASATKGLGFEEIKTVEQAEEAHAYARRLATAITEDLATDNPLGSWGLPNAKEHARELHRLLVAIERFWKE